MVIDVGEAYISSSMGSHIDTDMGQTSKIAMGSGTVHRFIDCCCQRATRTVERLCQLYPGQDSRPGCQRYHQRSAKLSIARHPGHCVNVNATPALSSYTQWGMGICTLPPRSGKLRK